MPPGRKGAGFLVDKKSAVFTENKTVVIGGEDDLGVGLPFAPAIAGGCAVVVPPPHTQNPEALKKISTGCLQKSVHWTFSFMLP